MVWMIWLSPSFLIFVLVVLVGVVIVFMSSGLLGVWVGFELSFFGFIPLLVGKSVVEIEAGVKYFVMQVLGSGVLILSILLVDMSFYYMLFMSEIAMSVCFFSGVFIKIGIFPWHFWYPTVMSGISWSNCFILSFWQKLGPMWFISVMGLKSVSLLLLMMVVTSIIGAVSGLGQTHFRPLLAYSSMVHMGWAGSLCLMGELIFLTYMLVYGFILFSLLVSISKSYISNLSGISCVFEGVYLVWVSVYFLSLGGLPPLLGMFLKLLGVMHLQMNFLLFLIFLIFSSLVSLVYYLNLTFNFFMYFGGVSFIVDSLVGVYSSEEAIIMVLSLLVNFVCGFLFLLGVMLMY